MKIVAVVASALVFSFGSAFAADEVLPADRVIAAIQIAVAANPGLIKEVDIDRERGRLTVEVEIIGADGRKTEVRIDPETNELIR